MNISLTPELEQYVKSKVATGMYNSVSEVMREALRLMEERDSLRKLKLESLQNEINMGMKSVEDGHQKKLDIDSIKAQGRKKLNK